MRRMLLALVLALPACRAPLVVPVLAPNVTKPFFARQKVVATHAGRQSSFDAVLQYDGTQLVLLALTPMGTKAFAVIQTGDAYSVRRFIGMRLPAPPAAVLRDIHAAYFDPPAQVLGDGWHRRRTGAGVRVHERWAAGRLIERVWGSRRDPQASRLRFVDPVAPGEIPRRLAFDHPDLGLRIEIHTLESTTEIGGPLPPGAGA
jgi:hypothetical protein